MINIKLFTAFSKKNIFAAMIAFMMMPVITTAQINGAWTRINSAEGIELREMLLVSACCFVITAFDEKDGKFHYSYGGKITLDGNELLFEYEFSSQDQNMIGIRKTYPMHLENKELSYGVNTWSSADKNIVSELSGSWLFSMRGGVEDAQPRTIGIPRKTMKILTGDYFQWIAYDTEKKEFYGTGGGTYSARDGNYSENIVFFSRNQDRVGAKLDFNYNVEGDNWHHKGKNSAGEPMYEIWVKRNKE
jgi:hypothetical protein